MDAFAETKDVMEEPPATRVIPQAIPEFEIGGTRAAQEIETVSEPVEEVNPQLLISIREWLETIDDSLFMLQYYDQIVSNFDSLKQIHDIYFHDGRLDTKFFVAAGITKLGHKRIIEKWFRETC